MKNKVLFLDRDGVINRIIKYRYGWDSPQEPKTVKIVDGIEKIISWANKHKILVIEISNQPGVAKGKMSQKMADRIEHKVHNLLEIQKAVINRVYICPHHPEALVRKFRVTCNCRKPKPGLIIKAADENDIDLRNSIFLGDKASDAIAAKKAKCKSMIYLHNEDIIEKTIEARTVDSDYKVTSMNEAFKILKIFFKLT